jgi:hypothetical protein
LDCRRRAYGLRSSNPPSSQALSRPPGPVRPFEKHCVPKHLCIKLPKFPVPIPMIICTMFSDTCSKIRFREKSLQSIVPKRLFKNTVPRKVVAEDCPETPVQKYGSVKSRCEVLSRNARSKIRFREESFQSIVRKRLFKNTVPRKVVAKYCPERSVRKMTQVRADRKMTQVIAERKMTQVGAERKMTQVGAKRKMTQVARNVK